jgi:hypothetical protein
LNWIACERPSEREIVRMVVDSDERGRSGRRWWRRWCCARWPEVELWVIFLSLVFCFLFCSLLHSLVYLFTFFYFIYLFAYFISINPSLILFRPPFIYFSTKKTKKYALTLFLILKKYTKKHIGMNKLN